MFTVRNHAADCNGQDGFLGRVVLPQIRVGQPVDQWFVLQTLEGKELHGPNGQPSGLHVKIYYGLASEVQKIGDPRTTPHLNSEPPSAPVVPADVPAATQAVPQTPPLPTNAGSGPPVVPPLPVDTRAPTPDAWVRPSTPQIIQTFAGTQFAFYLEVVEARNLAMPGGGGIADSFACVSLVHDAKSMEKQDFFLIDHLASNSMDARFLQLPPQHTTKKNAANENPVWQDACTLKGTHPGIKRIVELKNQNQLASSTELIPLGGQTVLLLATVHDVNAQGATTLVGRVVIPQIRAGQPVDQWFMLHGRDGCQIRDATGQDAAIRLRFAYGALKEAEPELPAGWEKKLDDATGKFFYVNHELKTFSWVAPPKSQAQAPPSSGPPLPPEQPPESSRLVQASPPAHMPPDDVSPAEPSAPQEPADEAIENGGGEAKLIMTISEGKDLPRMDHLSLSNAYICVSIIGDANGIDEGVHARLQHDVSKNKLRAGLRSSMLKLHPQYRTQVVNRSLNPKWSESVEFGDGYLNVAAIEELQQKGPPKEGKREKLNGETLLVFITVHHEVSGSEDTAIGRIILPAIKAGQEMADWFPLLTKDGTPQVGGMSEKPSQIRLQLKYKAEGVASKSQPGEEALHAQEMERERLEQETQNQLRLEQQAREADEEWQRKEKELREEGERQREHERAVREREAHEREAEAARQAAREMENAQAQEAAAAHSKAQKEAEEQERRMREEEDVRRQQAYAEQQMLQEAAQNRMQEEEQRRMEKDRDMARQSMPRSGPDRLAPYPVELQLRLALDMSVAGPSGSQTRASFEQDLVDDLSQASGLNPACFRIKKLSAGSIIVDVEIHGDPLGMGYNPKHVAADLERQAKDPNSPLSRGQLTCYMESILFGSPGDTPMPAVFPPKPVMHQARLLVAVLQARRLPQTHHGGCNAFCELSMETFGREEAVFARSSTVLNTCDPRWDQQFISGVDTDTITSSELKLTLYDWSPEMPRRLLGQIRKLRLSDLMVQSKTKVWFDVLTQDGMPLASQEYQASICIGLEYQAPAVEASVDVSPSRASKNASVEDGVPLISWQGSPMLAAIAANKAPPMPASPKRSTSPALPPAGSMHSPVLRSVASPRGTNLLSSMSDGGMMPPLPMDPKMSEAGLGIVLTVGPDGEYVVDSLLEVIAFVFFSLSASKTC